VRGWEVGMHKPEPDKDTTRALLLEPLSVEFNVLVEQFTYFHFGTFSLLAKLVQVFVPSFCFHSEREEKETTARGGGRSL
jgi:hypothetical protein